MVLSALTSCSSRPSLAPLRIFDRGGGGRVFTRPGLADLERRRAGTVELALQRLRGIDIDLALGAGRAVTSLADDLESRLGGHQHGQALAEQLLVVDDDDPDRLRLRALWKGHALSMSRSPAGMDPNAHPKGASPDPSGPCGDGQAEPFRSSEMTP